MCVLLQNSLAVGVLLEMCLGARREEQNNTCIIFVININLNSLSTTYMIFYNSLSQVITHFN